MNSITPKLVYSDKYNIRLLGLEKFYLFDTCKYRHAWLDICRRLNCSEMDLNKISVSPISMVSNSDILLVHDYNYVYQDVWKIRNLATILEIPVLAVIPLNIFINLTGSRFSSEKKIIESILNPMKFSISGTILASELALSNGLAINMSGGYHHATKDFGEGFCVFSDIAIAIERLRKNKYLNKDDTILIIDLDAHQGNGLERIFYDNSNVYILDMYNYEIFPQDKKARKFIDKNIPIKSGATDLEYLNTLKKGFAEFLNDIPASPKIAFYNAGTDIYINDPLGRLSITKDGVFERDKFVISVLEEHKIPCVMVLSGGYTKESYSLISNTISYVIKKYYPYFPKTA